MSINDYLEKWKDGTYRYVERDSKGKFKSVENKHDSKTKFYQSQKVGIWNNEPQQKIVPEINHKDYVKGDYYRASISLNVPLNGSRQHPNYVNFTYVVIDKLENINMQEMYNEIIEKIESKEGLHYKKGDWWFDYGFNDCDRQSPKPYSAKHPSRIFEGTNK